MLNIPERVKDAIKKGNTRKNVRVVVYTADGSAVDFTIDNDNLIYESMAMDERMCSEDNIKFGLCEGTKLEFQCFDEPNIKGRRIQVLVDVQYTDGDGEEATYSIPLGWYDVTEASRQASTGIMKYTCYNKLKSEYLDNNANEAIVAAVEEGDTGNAGQANISEILYRLLDGYTIKPKDKLLTSGADDSYTAIGTAGVYTRANVALRKRTAFGVTEYVSLDDSTPYAQLRDDNKTYLWKVSMIWTPSHLNSDILDYMNDINTHCKLSFNPKCFYDGVQSYNKSGWGDNIYCVRMGSFIPIATYLNEFYLNVQPIPSNYSNVYGLCFGGQGNSKSAFSVINIYPNKNKEYAESDYFTKIYDSSVMPPRIYMEIPLHTLGCTETYYQTHPIEFEEFKVNAAQEVQNTIKTYLRQYSIDHSRDGSYNFNFQVLEREEVPISYRLLTTAQAEALPNVTLRQLQSAVFETECQFGRLDRETDLIGGAELNHSRLYPADDLYPANDLYPASESERTTKSMYSKLWADEGNVHNFRNLIITYKTTENNAEVDKTVTYEVNADGTDDYVMDNNWLFRNLVWTDAQIDDYADAMVAKMQNLSWFPFDMDCVGLPYIETGDELEIKINNDTYTSYVLTRNMKGIQALKDNMKNGELNIF